MRAAVPFTCAVTAVAAIAASGCSTSSGNPDLVSGKTLFVKKCGSCHTLNRANSKGTTGPNLDVSFAQSKSEGFGASAIRGMVNKQILYPARAGAGGQNGVMPAGLVKGDDARDVAAYVAQSVDAKGKDKGLLATAGVAQQSTKPAMEKNGTISIPADPNGQLLYTYKSAQGQAGKITIEMPNQSGMAHNIAIDGKGKGPIISKGVSKFTATFSPGKYQFYCQVPGHKAAGMVGTLTVK